MRFTVVAHAKNYVVDLQDEPGLVAINILRQTYQNAELSEICSKIENARLKTYTLELSEQQANQIGEFKYKCTIHKKVKDRELNDCCTLKFRVENNKDYIYYFYYEISDKCVYKLLFPPTPKPIPKKVSKLWIRKT